MRITQIIASGLTSWGASSYSNGRQQGEAKNLIFLVLDRIFRRLCSWLRALTSCFLISIVEVKVQHRSRDEFLWDMSLIIAHVSLLHHLASRKIPCENISLTKLCKTLASTQVGRLGLPTIYGSLNTLWQGLPFVR